MTNTIIPFDQEDPELGNYVAALLSMGRDVREMIAGTRNPARRKVRRFADAISISDWELCAKEIVTGPAVIAPHVVKLQNQIKLPGRNDPCHCGSGKKFKKCHMSQ